MHELEKLLEIVVGVVGGSELTAAVLRTGRVDPGAMSGSGDALGCYRLLGLLRGDAASRISIETSRALLPILLC